MAREYSKRVDRVPDGNAAENSDTSGGDDFTPPPSSPSLHTGLSNDQGLSTRGSAEVSLTNDEGLTEENLMDDPVAEVKQPGSMPAAEEVKSGRSSQTHAMG